MNDDAIRLGHGAGGLLSARLIRQIILKYFDDPILGRLEDSAELPRAGGKLAFTTDAYVIDPIFFPGGDIGKLAVCGTVNVLAVKGADPRYLSFALIIEEGLPVADLERVLRSARQAARAARVRIVCGDTKVVEKGKADRLFITTSGVGVIRHDLGRERIRPGDQVLVSGTIGDHGIAVMNERLKLGLRSSIKSDVAPLNTLARLILGRNARVRFMRDPTRGGVASTLNEAIEGTGLGIMIEQTALPVRPQVRGASEMLGLDPLYIANEGKLVVFVDKKDTRRVLDAMRRHRLGRRAAVIGAVTDHLAGVWVRTAIGGTHPLLPAEVEGLPRIC